MYYCDLCEKAFIHKNDFRRHLNRVKLCGIETDAVNVMVIKKKYGIDEKTTKNDEKTTKNGGKTTKNDEKTTKNDEKTTKNGVANIPTKNNLECDHCHKIFCRADVKKKHISFIKYF